MQLRVLLRSYASQWGSAILQLSMSANSEVEWHSFFNVSKIPERVSTGECAWMSVHPGGCLAGSKYQ